MSIYELLGKGKEEIALRVCNSCNDSYEFAHIVIDTVYVKDRSTKYNDSIGFYQNYYDEKHQYKGLTISCQMDANNGVYATELSISGYTSATTLAAAEEIVKTLKPIKRKLAKIAAIEGDAMSFEDSVIRLVRVLGAKAFYARYDGNQQFQRNDNISMLRGHIAKLISDNKETLGFKKSA